MLSPKDISLSATNGIFFIAEAGINHNGCLEKAKELVDLAKRAGADAVKFQKRTISRILTKEGLNKIYNTPNSFGKTYGEHKEHLEFSYEQFTELKNYADEVGIPLTASGWDEESVDFLDSINVPFFKMASADLTNHPLLEHTAKKGRPMILSTGMANLDQVIAAYEVVSVHNKQVGILQCTSSYPTENKDINLNVIREYQKIFKEAVIGYSGHEKGIAISTAAVALGAKIVERHFTLDRTMKGGDHAASLEEPGLTKLIRDIRVVEEALGSDEKRKLLSEEKCFIKLAKSIVSTRDLKEGEIITRDMLTTKGPGSGISPTRMGFIIGKTITKDIEADSVIYNDDIC
jgi:sialic acid synthase